MTNPMIEKKVEEFSFYSNLDSYMRAELSEALTDMYETGRLCGADELSSLMDIDKQATIEILTQEGKKTGAADMKERILEALPEEIEMEKGSYIHLHETVANIIKSIQSIQSQ